MTKTSKLALIAALAMSIASPAFAQSFAKEYGTGNELPFAYGPSGTERSWTATPENNQFAAAPQVSSRGHVAARQTGRDSFAAVGTQGLYNYGGSAPLAGNPNSPAATGGGSTGYNQLIETY